MKLWTKTTKRIAKKTCGRYWKKLTYGLSLKPGDLISTCKGYNERIKEIIPCYCYGFKKARILIDFDIETEVGSCCSLIHCCTFPLETKEQIIKYWSHWPNSKIAFGLSNGQEVFDTNGQPTEAFSPEYEKAVRFPKN